MCEMVGNNLLYLCCPILLQLGAIKYSEQSHRSHCGQARSSLVTVLSKVIGATVAKHGRHWWLFWFCEHIFVLLLTSSTHRLNQSFQSVNTCQLNGCHWLVHFPKKSFRYKSIVVMCSRSHQKLKRNFV